MKSSKLFLMIVVTFFCSNLFCAEIDSAYEEEKLSLVVTKEFDRRFESPAKKFSFYRGNQPITEKEFESIIQDPEIQLAKKKLQQIKVTGFSISGALGGVAVGFLIPSLSFIIGQTNYTEEKVRQAGYSSWLQYYNSNYAYVFLPGILCIVLTGLFSLSSLIGVAVTFYAMYKYQYPEALYQDAVDRYNIQLKKKYQIVPDISMGINQDQQEVLSLSFTIRL